MSFQVQAFGSNGSGQLALGHTDDVSHPEDCLFEDEKPTSRPIRIVAGGNHTLLLCRDGSVFATGNNDNGRCGIPRSNALLTKFVRVRFPDANGNNIEVLEHVAATWEASFFVTFDGRVFSSGTGNFGELGQGYGVTESFVPRVIPDFPPSGTRIVDMVASMRHSVVVLSDQSVYGWGAGRKGQIGTPMEKAVPIPRLILLQDLEDPFYEQSSALRAVCCRDQTGLLCAAPATTESRSQLIVFGTDSNVKAYDQALHEISPWIDIAASWSAIYILEKHGVVKGLGKHWLPSDPNYQVHPKAVAAGSEHLLVGTQDGKVLATGWGEHGNCGSPVDDQGIVENGWNEIGPGAVLGAGCATSFILKD